jgi:cytochrome P450
MNPSTMTGPSLDDELARALASDPDAMAEAPRIWRRIREEAPVHHHGPLLVLSGHEHCKPILRDRDRFVTGGHESSEQRELRASMTAKDLETYDELLSFQQLIMSRTPDVDRHDRLRRVAHRAFTPRRIEDARESVVRYTDQLLDELDTGEVVDVGQLAYRLPLMVIADMLGVPHEDHAKVHHWCGALSPAIGSAAQMRSQIQAVHEFRDYLQAIVDAHREDPASVSPLVASMLDAEQDERLSLDELVAMFANLSFAGHETTANLISIGIVELLLNHEQWQLLTDDPSLAASATEELLRWVTPVQFIRRMVSEPLEVAGEQVPAGQTILLLLAGANRDPAVFADSETLDITRADAREHLSLGFGPRYCLGVSLARLEGEIAFGRLAQRHPNLQLAADAFEWHGASMLRRLKRVPVRLG